MKARPIIFKPDMVSAILDGRKTKTRRIVKPSPGYQASWMEPRLLLECPSASIASVDGAVGAQFEHPLGGPFSWVRCPYGQPGDLLWVRETWQQSGLAYGNPTAGAGRMHYRADADHGWQPYWGGWRSPMFMPRWASRLTLRVTGVRVERLQEISEDDAGAEGLRGNEGGEWGCEGLIEDFEALWESINGTGSWDENPWVWVIEFEPIRANVDEAFREAA